MGRDNAACWQIVEEETMAINLEKFIKQFRVEPGSSVKLSDYKSDYTGGYDKPENASELLEKGIDLLSYYQDRLYAENSQALLVVMQAMDAAGKDSCIEHVMSGVNPAGCQVTSFKAPTVLELDHTYLWRCMNAVPARGMIGIFNRSHYEEVLVVRVHPAFLKAQRLPPETLTDDLWSQRFEEINNWEKHLSDNGVTVVKIYLNVGKDEQCVRQMERIDIPEKHWKFNAGDLEERKYWDEYVAAYEEMFKHTSTDRAPWYIVPADKKWFTRLAVAAIIVETLEGMDPQFPTVGEEAKKVLSASRDTLLAECGDSYEAVMEKVQNSGKTSAAADGPQQALKKEIKEFRASVTKDSGKDKNKKKQKQK